MPTREIKQPLTPRNALKQQHSNTPTKSVDEEMVDPSSDEDEKKVDKKELNEKIIELNKNLVGKKNGNNNNVNRISSSSNSGERLTGTTNKMYGNRNAMTSGQVQRYNQGYCEFIFLKIADTIFVRKYFADKIVSAKIFFCPAIFG